SEYSTGAQRLTLRLCRNRCTIPYPTVPIPLPSDSARTSSDIPLSSSTFVRAALAGATAADESNAQYLYLRTHFRRVRPRRSREECAAEVSRPRRDFLLFRPRFLIRESQLGGEVPRAFLPAPGGSVCRRLPWRWCCGVVLRDL
ncbi:RIKEN cDNA A630052C17, isoform CRA_a, partial [Mus musculus]